MTSYWGPKLSFSMPKKQQEEKEVKGYSALEMESTDCFKNYQKKKVEFASTITIFLRYQDEEIWKFKERLKNQVELANENLNLNPTLWSCTKQKTYKSCMKSTPKYDS